ncbi:MAG TPA: hypothetical protein VNL74_08875 [Methylococcus sp.]|nr:hypothetical protein [Methylococcus sp.]
MKPVMGFSLNQKDLGPSSIAGSGNGSTRFDSKISLPKRSTLAIVSDPNREQSHFSFVKQKHERPGTLWEKFGLAVGDLWITSSARLPGNDNTT